MIKYDGAVFFEDGLMFRFQAKLTPTTFLVVFNVLVYVYTSLLGGNFIETDTSVLFQFGQFVDDEDGQKIDVTVNKRLDAESHILLPEIVQGESEF